MISETEPGNRKKFKLWCNWNGISPSARIRELIEFDIAEANKLIEQFGGEEGLRKAIALKEYAGDRRD